MGCTGAMAQSALRWGYVCDLSSLVGLTPTVNSCDVTQADTGISVVSGHRLNAYSPPLPQERSEH